MDDLRTRFANLDAVGAPDLWGDIETRASAQASAADALPVSTEPVRGRRAVPGPASRRSALTGLLGVGLVAIVLLVLSAFGLRWSGGVGGGGPSATETPSVAPSPTRTTSSTTPTCGGPAGRHPSGVALPEVGFVGLPAIGTAPTDPSIVELVDCYALSKETSTPPYQGGAWLFADGRLIWYEYLGFHGELGSTGYLEQRLTPEGVELLKDHPVPAAKHPLAVSEWMPARGWAEETVRPYVPRNFAVCVGFDDGRPGLDDRPPSLGERLRMLPEAATDLLIDEPLAPVYVEDMAYIEDCPRVTTAEARELDAILSAAGLERDERSNRLLLEYHLDLDGSGPDDRRVDVFFEPIHPDGRYSCSHCG